jgi:hypothetical protein
MRRRRCAQPDPPALSRRQRDWMIARLDADYKQMTEGAKAFWRLGP